MRKRRPRKPVTPRRQGFRGGLFLFALFFLSFVLLILSRLENDYVRTMRGQFADLAAPVLEWASLPAVYLRHGWERAVSYASLFEELDRLRGENQRLRQWEWRARRLERKVGHLRALVNATDEQALKYTSGRVIADGRGPFVRTVLINAGRQDGVKAGYAVINGDGLVGRTVHVGESASRVILVNDLNSRIPVLVGPAAVRAVLAGDNSPDPRIEFAPDNTGILVGDEVYSSGDGGLLPRGLRIGVVSSVGTGGFRVRTHASLSELEYVSVLFFDSPLVLARDPAAPGRRDAVSAAGPIRPAGDRQRVGRLGNADRLATVRGGARAERQ